MHIHLIRHGKTAANEQRLYCGATDIPLSADGIAELLELKQQRIYPGAVMFFTSGMMRTDQTLDTLYGAVDREHMPEFAEFDFGIFEMKSYETLKADPNYQAWITDETGLVSCPNGENRNAFTRRVVRGCKLLTKKTNDVIVVCHGGVIVTIMDYIFPNQKNFYEWQPKPGRGYTITITPDGHKQYKPI